MAKVAIPVQRTSAVRNVFLTLDDGPHPSLTPRILKILEGAKIKATFFMLGQNAEAHLDIVRAVHAAGHRIGNHSFSHPDLTRLPESTIQEEISKTDRILSPYLGRKKLFRPPYGAHNSLVDKVSVSLGYATRLWNVDTRDWDKQYQPDAWVQHGIDQVRKGDTLTILNHDIHKTTVDHYQVFIDRIKGLGPVEFKQLDDTDELVS